MSAWREEIIELSNIDQDADTSVSPAEGERRFRRFVELVDGVRGDEEDAVFLTLLETLKDQEDYGAYESVFGALSRFSPNRRGALVARGVLSLLVRDPSHAGDVLAQIAMVDAAAAAFNEELATQDLAERMQIAEFIGAEERGGWLNMDERRGKLRVQP